MIGLEESLTGGEGGIRTPDRGVSPYNGLANRRLQPLGHLSGVFAASGIVPAYGHLQSLLKYHFFDLACRARFWDGYPLTCLIKDWALPVGRKDPKIVFDFRFFFV
jgi:hypothetical protein